MNPLYDICFRCYYGTNYNTHYTSLSLKEIPKWIEAYQFTHPNVKSISVRVRIKTDPGD